MTNQSQPNIFKCIVAGSRRFTDYALMKRKLDNFFSNIEGEIEIISGTAQGADTLGERYALENGLSVRRMAANWEKYGRKAGYARNEEMAKYAALSGGACVVFWVGKSSGSGHMIDLAKKYKLRLRIVECY